MGSEALSAEAIREIERLVKAGAKTEFVRNKQEPEHVYWRVNPEGTAEVVEVEPPLWSRHFKRPDDVVAALSEGSDFSRTTFYDETAIQVVQDDDCRKLTTCPMEFSPQFQWLKTKSAGAFDQRAFVRLLRIDFRGCLDGAPDLLGLVRNLKFTNAGQAVGNIQHGRESLGKSIESQVSGESSLPEEIRVTVPIWKNWNVRQDIACAIEIDSQSQTFRLTPYPNELDNALDRSLMALHAFLAGDKGSKRPPVFRGHPVIAGRKVDGD